MFMEMTSLSGDLSSFVAVADTLAEWFAVEALTAGILEAVVQVHPTLLHPKVTEGLKNKTMR